MGRDTPSKSQSDQKSGSGCTLDGMVKRRQTYTPLPPSTFAIGWLIACCTYIGVLVDVAIFKVLGLW